MKYLSLILALALLGGSSAVHAKTEAKKTKKSHVIKKEKKSKKPEAKPAQVQKSRRISQSKKVPYKNVTKRAAAPAPKVAPATASPAPVAQPPVAAEPTAIQKVGNWLGLGTAGTAASATAKSYLGQHRQAGYHIGPRNWHHNFPTWWGERGWTAADVDGVWYFAGHPIEWWASKPVYESYYKNVIRPLYLKAHPEKR